jgi:hypothetical protein
MNGGSGFAPAGGGLTRSPVIQRVIPPTSTTQPVGMATEKTHMRKPNKAKTAPKKLGIFNRLKPAIGSGDKVVLLANKVMDGTNVKWQLAKHPTTGAEGFVRMSKVLATGKASTGTVADPESTDKVEQVEKLSSILGDIANDGTELGESIGDMLSVKGKTSDELAELLLDYNPDFAQKFDKASDTEKEGMVAGQLPGLKDILGKGGQTGFKIGGLTGGLIGEGLGMFSGLLSMVQGIKKFGKTDAELSDKLEGVLATGGGIASILTGVMGMGSKISGFVGDMMENEGVKSTFEGLKETFGFFGSGIDTVKGVVETVVKVVQAIAGGLKNRGKSAKSKLKDFVETVGDIAGTVLGTVKSGIETVAGVLKLIKSVPLVSSILGIVGSVVDLVSGALDLTKSVYEMIKLIVKTKKEKAMEKELKDDEYTRTERNLYSKLRRMEIASEPAGQSPGAILIERDKQGIPTAKQEETTLGKYKTQTAGNKTATTDRDQKDVETHLTDRVLVDTVRKRIKRAYSQIPEIIVDGVAAGISIVGGLISIGADIAAVVSAPTGVGTAAALATKTIASTVSSVLSGGLKVGKAIYKMARVGVRKIKQFARDKGWSGTNQDKTSKAKLAKRKQETIRLMSMVASLTNYDPADDASKAAYTRAQLRLKASGVDTMELFEKNGEPAEQAKMILEALNARK